MVADSKKREREAGNDDQSGAQAEGGGGKRRRSRFADEGATAATAVGGAAKSAAELVAALESKISKQVSKVGTVPSGGGAGALNGAAGAGGAASASAAKAAQLKAMQERLQAQLSSTLGSNAALRGGVGLGGQAAPKKARDFSLRLDSEGRQVDADGNLVSIGGASAVATLKINKEGPAAKAAAAAAEVKAKANPYLAHRVEAEEAAAAGGGAEGGEEGGGGREVSATKPVKARPKRGFNFVEQGTYQRMAETMRSRAQRRLLRGIAEGRANNAEVLDPEIASALKKEEQLDKLPPCREVQDPPPPEVEWWDEPFLDKELRMKRRDINNYNSKTDMYEPEPLGEDEKGTDALYARMKPEHSNTLPYIQHPAKVTGEAPKEKSAPMPVFLTKQERKRIRRQNRKEKEQENADMRALGLLPTPEPKMKLSNFMRVIGEQAIMDPSKVEKLVVSQVQGRREEHDMKNLAAKLTPDERREKKRNKIAADHSKEVQVAVFRVSSLDDPKKRFKVDVNAQQMYMTGTVLMLKDSGINMVVVEGGPKSVKRYVKLMTRRIKWGVDDDGDDLDSDSDDEDDTAATVKTVGSPCELVWRGTILKRSFTGFRFQECNTSMTARKQMAQKGVAQYWDMVVKSHECALNKV